MDDMTPAGCWCYMPAAAKAPGKDCWARIMLDDASFGWSEDLRP